MAQMRETISVADMDSVDALYRDYVLKRGTELHAAIGEFHADAPEWAATGSRTARVDARLVARLIEFNRECGASEAVLDGLRGLEDGSVRAIITGQQPGVAGGPLMTLYKIATVCALAQTVQARHGVRCVPIFWMGADDADVDEIRELAAIASDVSLVSASLPPAAYTPGMRVGDIGAGEVRDVLGAIAPYLPDGTGARDAVASWIAPARDLGDAAARVIARLAGGGIAVIDGREPVMRECARDLLLAFFDREDTLRESIDKAGRRLAASGYHAQLDLGDSSGIFLVIDGARQKVPPGMRSEARARLAQDITLASPGVVARNLMQDALFDPLAVVLGPAEIAYRVQIAGVYSDLGVPRPVVFPRMSATFIPPAVADFARAARVGAAVFATDPASIPDAARAGLRDTGFSAAADAALDAFGGLSERFRGVADGRLDVRGRDKLEKRLADLSHRLRQAVDAAVDQDQHSEAARFPFLPRVPELFARAGVPQERYLSMIVPYLFHGERAWPAIRALADESVAAALDGRAGHRVYSV